MGGNALKHCTSRISKEDYVLYQKELHSILCNLFQHRRVAFPPELANKESFGDIDALFESDNLPSDWIDKIVEKFNLKESEYVKNGNCFSFKYKKAQVDLILTPNDIFFASYTYFSYNDIWNLLGRLGHKLGIKVGHDGLYLIVRPEKQSNHIVGDICLSKSVLDVLPILGLSKERYNQGFESQEEMYRYVAQSKYFNPDIFLLDNRNATSRVRDKKRKVYSDFLIWIENNRDSIKNNYNFESVDERGGYSIREPYFSDVIVPHFGDWVAEELNRIIAEYELNQKYKSLFDGYDIKEITGLDGKPLGALISEMKSLFPDKKFAIEKLNKNWITQFAGFLSENPICLFESE